EIRTLETDEPPNGFQDRRIQPLCHSSVVRAKLYATRLSRAWQAGLAERGEAAMGLGGPSARGEVTAGWGNPVRQPRRARYRGRSP
ncbi:hypothetical protein, partial [uncultured Parolsenella sp.]|uniref:hypothetical protein n=1 Tax=uncultured Parolsenella sp. TaxID=2083008 RepID=UPI0027DDBF46